MSSGLQDDGIKESERPFVERGAFEHNTRHRLERLESFAFLKEFSGISYQTHRGEGGGAYWRFPIEILYKMEVERANFPSFTLSNKVKQKISARDILGKKSFSIETTTHCQRHNGPRVLSVLT